MAWIRTMLTRCPSPRKSSRVSTRYTNLPFFASLFCAGINVQGVTTVELDNLAAETAAYMTTKHPDYAILAARYKHPFGCGHLTG
jgi:hypothetical protein